MASTGRSLQDLSPGSGYWNRESRLVEECERAHEAFRRSVSYLLTALRNNQSRVVDRYYEVEEKYQEMEFATSELSTCLAARQTSVTVQGMDPDVLIKEAHSTYVDVISKYDSYVIDHPFDVAPRTPAQSSSFSPRRDVLNMQNFSNVSHSVSPMFKSNYAKEEFPTWDGKPGRSWLEFRGIWEEEVVPLFTGRRLALARLLRRNVKGPAGRDIEHISLSGANCYDTMWKILTDKYDNVAINVHIALQTFDSLRSVSDNDHVYLLKFIRTVKSAHDQLKVLSQVDQVDSLRVGKISSHLPMYLREGWARIFSSLPNEAKFHPLAEFVKFLDSKVSTIEALVELSDPLACFSDNKRQPAKGGKSTRQRSAAVSIDVNACALHPGSSNHETAQCRPFLQMTARQRADFCTDKKLCKRCFLDKHEGDCHKDFSCKRCKGKVARSHNELLCFKTDEGKPPISKPYGQPGDKQFNPPRNFNIGMGGDEGTQFSGPSNCCNHAPCSQIHPSHCVGGLNTCNSHVPACYQAHVKNQTAVSESILPGPSSRMNNLSPSPDSSSDFHGSSLSANHAQGSMINCPPGGRESSSQPMNDPGSRGRDGSKAPVINPNVGTNAFTMKVAATEDQDNPPDPVPDVGFHNFGVYPIYSSPVSTSSERAVVFCDDGSDCSLITEDGIKRLNAEVLEHGYMDMTTVSGTKRVDTKLCKVILVSRDGRKHPVICHSIQKLFGLPYQLNENVLKSCFPSFDTQQLQRPKSPVDLLLGCDYFGLHPKRELASDGHHLSVMEGLLGVTVQGSHRNLTDKPPLNPRNGFSISFSDCSIGFTSYRGDIPLHRKLYNSSVSTLIFRDGESPAGSLGKTRMPPEPVVCAHEPPEVTSPGNLLSSSGPEPEVVCPAAFASARGPSGPDIDQFVLGEQLGTSCIPRCGSCKCGKCPLPGHSFSFKEEQELDLIQSKLRYEPDPGRWVTGYPWLVDPSSMPNNYVAALSTLVRTEKTLAKEPEWQAIYQAQIEDHRTRGVARKLTPEEITSWEGPVFYLSHMAVEQPKSESTPVRIVFNSSQKYKGVSLNSCLAKGPDCFNNNLLGMLIRFRENSTILIGDIRKMYNTVHLEELEQHMHRFLWRECDSTRRPDIWVITRVNLGDRPSGTIAIAAKNNTAHMFSDICPEAAQMLVYCTYTDDVINSVRGGYAHASFLAEKASEILGKGEFKVKAWYFAGPEVPDANRLKGERTVLGITYNADADSIVFPAKLNFSPRRRNVPTGPNMQYEEILSAGLPVPLTRRIVLGQVMAIYDPLGLLAPFVLQAKLLLRKTWQLKLEWDEPVGDELQYEWRRFFTNLFDAEKINFPRCLTPENAVGNPQLILFSDGSEVAYGAVAYIRWKTTDGYWCRIIMAKSRIAPLNRINIPQMELNGAVLQKRLRESIEAECRFQFEKVFHIIDSETVLCQLYKVSQKFPVYEGVRIGEIQGASGGNMSDWAWVAGVSNIADITTRPQTPLQIAEDSVWVNGPDFLYDDVDVWPIKFDPHVSPPRNGEDSMFVSPNEERSFSNFHVCRSVCSVDLSVNVNGQIKSSKPPDLVLFENSLFRCSRTSYAVGGLARVLNILRTKSFRGGGSKYVTPTARREALKMIVVAVQQYEWTVVEDVRRQFRHINVGEYDGTWVAHSRDPRTQGPLTPDHRPQIILPSKHRLTFLLMRDAHCFGRHGGRDATIRRFRAKYHTSHADKIAGAVCRKCALCKLIKVKLQEQKMGMLPVERLSPGIPFAVIVLDLFGPYLIKGEVQKRTTSKVWGVIFVDIVSRAVHIEITTGYDTQSFMIAFRRYASVRGWPSRIYSDPGTQLVGASAEVSSMWKSFEESDTIKASLSRSGTEWIFGPADSPWHQGAAEALIKSAKLAIKTSVGESRLSFSELLTSFSEVANLLNERPIGLMPAADNGLSILTPNQLILGRSTSVNPGDYHVPCSVMSRVTMVNDVVNDFWNNWTELYLPTLIRQRKWTQEFRSIRVGDIVYVADSNVVRGEYRLARVIEVHPGSDGIVRRVTVRYVIYKSIGKDMKLRDGRIISVERSVQRLALIVPVEEQ